MNEATNKLTSLISSLNLGSEEMPVEVYVPLTGEEIVDVEYNMVELLDLAWDTKFHLGLDVNEKPMTGSDVVTNQHQ